MSTANVPMESIGPLHIICPNDQIDEQVMVPLATYESPLWPSTNRGAKVTRTAGGIHTVIIDDRMTRSILLEADSACQTQQIASDILSRKTELHEVAGKTSQFANLIEVRSQQIGTLLFLRLEFTTGDAAGHNMTTKAAQAIMEWLLNQYPELQYVSISGNFCTDKKVSAVNGLFGRGKNVVADLTIPRALCEQSLHTTPEAIHQLNLKKNLIGSSAAGGLRTANAHFANMLLAFYLATGQDAANIVEGSQGFVYTQIKNGDLYFSVTVPNLIVGTIGNGKGLPFVQDNLAQLGCATADEPGRNARKLAVIAAGTILCGELSLMAALTNPGELMRSHIAIEREGNVKYERQVQAS